MALAYLALLAVLLPFLSHSAYVHMGIVNGREAKPHSRPYMVSVQRNKQHICGGFLVSEHFVMTAAHCRKRKEDKLTVVLGAHELTNNMGHTAVKFYHVHKKYDRRTFSSDIMLLQLDRATKRNDKINWISIPKKDTDVKDSVVCSVAGWGRLQTNGNLSEVLREADVRIIDKKLCKQSWGKHYSVSRMVCAGGSGGFCQGDSGGPLVCNNTAVGIVSFTDDKDCNDPEKPNVYTKISKFLPWIKRILRFME